MLIDDLEFDEMSHLDLKGAFCWQEFQWNDSSGLARGAVKEAKKNSNAERRAKVNTDKGASAPAVVKEIPKQSSKDVKANSKKSESRKKATIPASQLKPGRSKMVMLRKGERTTEGRPSPREIKNASAGIRKARFNAERERRARRVAKGLPARVSDPTIERLIPRSAGNVRPRDLDISRRSNIPTNFSDVYRM
ncbi:MAG TPA: hypothetical protein V6C58_02655 [Allocoleopsis sp.]